MSTMRGTWQGRLRGSVERGIVLPARTKRQRAKKISAPLPDAPPAAVPLCEREDVLHMVYDMLGAKCWAYCGGVSHSWRRAYLSKFDGSKETAMVHVVASLATYRYSLECGRVVDHREDGLLGAYAELEVLAQYATHSQQTAKAAVKANRPQVLQFMRDRNWHFPTCYMEFLCLAALHGSLECLRWVINSGDPVFGLYTAGHLPEHCKSKVGVFAADGGHIHVLKWLHSNGLLPQQLDYDDSLCTCAAKHNHYEAVVWLFDHGYLPGPRTCAAAALAGNMELLQWLLVRGYNLTVDNMPDVARGSSLAVLKHLHSAGIGAWDTAVLTSMLQEAGFAGKLEAVQWLYSLGAQLPTIMWHWQHCWPKLRTLQWAMHSGANWGASAAAGTCKYLRRTMDADAWMWAHEHGCPCNALQQQ
jgi:hypothetical protein